MSSIKPLERKFGVEIEVGYVPERGYRTSRDCSDMYGDCGDGYCYCYDEDLGETTYAIANEIGFDVHEEHCGVEFVSPILQGKEGFKALEKAFSELNKAGVELNGSCGMHIHLDASDLGPRDRLKVVKSWAANQDEIMQFTPSRNLSNWCRPWSARDIQEYEVLIERTERGEFSYYGHRLHRNHVPLYERYKTIFPESDHGTFEIRQHHATLDFAEAEAWIKFCMAFVARAVKGAKPMTKCGDVPTLVKRVRTAKRAQSTLLQKVGINGATA